MSIESQEYQQDIAELWELIGKMAPFVYRARFPSKSPHLQNREDAEIVWQDMEDAGYSNV